MRFIRRTVFGVAVALLVCTSVHAQPVFDAASVGDGGLFGSNSVSFAHTITGSNPYLYCAAALSETDDMKLTGMTYNGVAMTKLATASQTGGPVTISYYFASCPATGAHNVVATMTSTPFSSFTCQSYTGVDGTTPHGTPATGNDNTSSISINVTSATGELVVDAIGALSSGLTVGAGQTQRGQHVDAHDGVRSASSEEAGAGTVAMSWTVFNYAASIGVSLKPGVCGGGGGGGVASTQMLMGVGK